MVHLDSPCELEFLVREIFVSLVSSFGSQTVVSLAPLVASEPASVDLDVHLQASAVDILMPSLYLYNKPLAVAFDPQNSAFQPVAFEEAAAVTPGNPCQCVVGSFVVVSCVAGSLAQAYHTAEN